MATTVIQSDLNVNGNLTANTMTVPTATIGNAQVKSDAAIDRSKLAQDNLAPYAIPLTLWRVWDNLAALLPATSATDDLGLYPGTWGTTPWLIRSADVKTTTVTLRAACDFAIPAEYVDGETITLRAVAGMITTVSDGAATLDFEVYRKTGDGATLSADLCATGATTIKNLTFAEIDFQVTPTACVAGDILQIRMTMAIADTATATAVIGAVESVQLLCDVKG